ncbi:hypothetical protein B0J12DRAFT_674425 [Macrophomina phaseolina]|uniref:Thiamine-binding protein domain-containing protein n=1 Tax=Macrophomina phaseolina TaxID=35725 RepID=A0ABQ8G1Y4_9PEZI|nr:hypothetical protein B0J12DRAFT_674425 [Macrophomina phaseolina]
MVAAPHALPAQCQADFCVVPVGSNSPSISSFISKIEVVLQQSTLEYEVHDSGTRIKGDWTEVMNIIGQAHTLIHDSGVQRVHTDVRIETRTDKLN